MRQLILTLIAALALTGLTACGSADSAPQAETLPIPLVPSDPNCPAVPAVPRQLTVRLENHLIGQIEDMANGHNGWTSIGNAHLLLNVNCTIAADDTVTCLRYPTEPYAYSSEPQ